jgi:hypothetical protein
MLKEIQMNLLPERAAALEVYRRMRRYGKSMDVASGPEDTPYEFSASLSSRLQRLGLRERKPAFIPQSIHELQSISDEIVQALYRPSPSGTARDPSVLHSWRGLRWKLRLIWILKHWGSLISSLKEKWTWPIG